LLLPVLGGLKVAQLGLQPALAAAGADDVQCNIPQQLLRRHDAGPAKLVSVRLLPPMLLLRRSLLKAGLQSQHDNFYVFGAVTSQSQPAASHRTPMTVPF